jgi:hypothetical protein
MGAARLVLLACLCSLAVPLVGAPSGAATQPWGAAALGKVHLATPKPMQMP